LIVVANKIDQLPMNSPFRLWAQENNIIMISASLHDNINELKERMLEIVHADKFKTGNTLITNVRHLYTLQQTYDILNQVLVSIDEERTGDLLSLEIRSALHHLGEITGEITTDDLLATIFSKFCIGK
jgi:tRNA modification GTPase